MSASPNSATPANSLTRRESADPPKSDLHDDRQHERPEARTFPEEPLQIDANLLLDQPRIRPLLDARSLERRGEQRRDLLQQRLGARVQDEPARDDVGRLFQRARLTPDG